MERSNGIEDRHLFMEDNASLWGACYSHEWLASCGFVEDQLNLIEYLKSCIKSELYKEEKQYCSLNELWHAITKVAQCIDNVHQWPTI